MGSQGWRPQNLQRGPLCRRAQALNLKASATLKMNVRPQLPDKIDILSMFIETHNAFLLFNYHLRDLNYHQRMSSINSRNFDY